MAEMTRDEAAAICEQLSGKVPGLTLDQRVAINLGIEALRSPGAGAMREAAAKVAHDAALEYQSSGDHKSAGLCERIANAIDALPLPAPEVPGHRYCTLCGRETPHAPMPPDMRTETTT